MGKIQTERKNKANQLKEKGNAAFHNKKYLDAEKFYSEAIELNTRSRPLWTSRAGCRNTMKKYEEAISDCDSGLSIDPKCSRSIIEKGIALVGLRRFDEAKEVFESLRPLGRYASADFHMKKLHDAQDRISQVKTCDQWPIQYRLYSDCSDKNLTKVDRKSRSQTYIEKNKSYFVIVIF